MLKFQSFLSIALLSGILPYELSCLVLFRLSALSSQLGGLCRSFPGLPLPLPWPVNYLKTMKVGAILGLTLFFFTTSRKWQLPDVLCLENHFLMFFMWVFLVRGSCFRHDGKPGSHYFILDRRRNFHQLSIYVLIKHLVYSRYCARKKISNSLYKGWINSTYLIVEVGVI